MDNETQAVETEEIPLEQATMPEFKKARAEGKDVVTREAAPPEEKAASEEKPKVKGGFQARIDRLIKQQAATEERALAAEKKAAELEAKANGATPKTEAKVDAEPVRENFQTEAEFIRALTRWEVKQELKAEREAEEKEAQAAAAKEAITSYNKKAIEAQAAHEDWNEVFKQDINIPIIVGDAIVHTIKNGPEVAYFLGKNPEICEEMCAVHPLEAVAMAVKISEQLEKNSGEEAETEEEEEPEEKAEKAAAEEEKPVRKAPAPIKPVSGGTTRSTIPLAKTDYQTYKKLRAQGRVQ